MDFENELMWGNRGIAIASLGDDRADRCGPAALPAALVSLAEHSERLGRLGDEDLAVDCSNAVAQKLTNRMWQRAHELASQGRLAHPLPQDVSQFGRELSPQAVINVLGAVVGAHLEYDARSVERRQNGSRLARLLEIAKAAWDLRAGRSVRIARQVTDRGVARGVCSHYATAMRTLFYALKRATGAPTDAFVVEVVGEAFGPQDNMHAWNWLIDVERASIAAFDATQIRGQRRKLSIDLKRYHNISAFLATAVRQAATSHGLDPRKVAELLAASVDPETDRGQALLFGIADHSGMNLGLRNRLAEHLASRNFERLLPDWRERLARRTALLGPLGRWVFQGSAGDTLPLPLARLRLPKAQQGLHPDPITGADPRPVKLVWRDRTWELTTSGAHSAVLAEWCSPTSSARSSRRDETPSF